MRDESRRQKRIASLLQEALSRILIDELREDTGDLVTVTRVDVPADLKSARIYVSIYGPDDPADVLVRLGQRAGPIRRILASSVKLKYNPQLFFALDPSADLNDRIEQLLGPSKKNERSAP
jgi:ribosome-binding factor A